MAKKNQPARVVASMRLSKKLMQALSHIATQENRSVGNLVETVMYEHAQKRLGVPDVAAVDRAGVKLAKARAAEPAASILD